jgi:prepilin-type N-terminal cleavage/methylation domain-containing protein
MLITAMRRSPRTVHRAAGFTLAEMLVALAVMAIVIVGVLMLFDFNSRLARAQTNVAEMQQSLRVAQQSMVHDIRMAGRGGLPTGALPAGLAVAVRNDVGSDGDRDVARGFEGSPQVVEGTDVLTVRGVFATTLYQINNVNPGTFTLTDDGGGTITGGTLLVASVSHTGVNQSTQPLVEAVEPPDEDDDPIPQALILVSPLDDSIYAVVELDPAGSEVSDPDNLTIAFKWRDGTYTDAYQALTGGAVFPSNLTSVAFAGILEEYRFYVREERAVPGDAATELRPRLSRARMFPGTEIPYLGDVANAGVDISDNILDLQVALGVDTDNDGVLVDAGDETDEWLYNSPVTPDDDEAAVWNQAGRKLFYVRLNTLARTERREWQYRSPPVTGLEDHAYDEADVPADDAEREERMFHRRLIQTVVDMRNVT